LNERHFILATAGHVDHGKSALVKALTGTDPDRLPEEKARGITIELGFAHFELNHPDKTDTRFSIGIIDVPGHEDFVKNMVAGVGSIDLALLVVAADDGWMRQTEEHLQILTYLEVNQAVVALTKTDLAKAEETEVQIREQLQATSFTDAPIVQTSVMDGRGINELRAQLSQEFASMHPQRDILKPRLAVDRAFAIRGVGTVVTGTLSGGKFVRGQAVVVQPNMVPARIRMIQSHNREVEEIGPGTRTALNLSEIPLAKRKGDRGVRRGDVITLAELGKPAAAVDVQLVRSLRLPPETRPIKDGTMVRVHHGCGNFSARISFQRKRELRHGESGIAELRFQAPVFFFAGDRFIVRDTSEQHTLGGGIVLDPDGSPKNFQSAIQTQLLEHRALAARIPFAFVTTQLAHDRVISRSSALLKSCFGANEIARALDDAVQDGRAVTLGDFVVDAKWWEALRGLAVEAIDSEHRKHPNHVGLDLAKLRGALASDFLKPELFEALLTELCKSGFARAGEAIKRLTHRPALPPPLQSACARVRIALAGKPFDPPSRKELAPDSASQQALRFLRDSGEVTELSADVLIATENFARMKVAAANFLRKKGAASVSDIRQILGSSRRVVVPFLERCDSDGLTQREGDKRVLKQH
jgi:selenocysteine-specific elongation factor